MKHDEANNTRFVALFLKKISKITMDSNPELLTIVYTECPKIYRKSVQHLLKYRFTNSWFGGLVNHFGATVECSHKKIPVH